MIRLSRKWPLAAVIFTAAFFLTQALWIPAKAQLAQWLIAHAWQRSLDGDTEARPWPWADTKPVAVLEAPRLGIRQFVLEGASGRNLAFGPAAVNGISSPDLVLSGHRDTHFEWIKHLEDGETLRLITRDGTREYKIAYSEIIDSRKLELVVDPQFERLSLVSCYPFDQSFAGGPLRYIVTALGEPGF